MQNTTLNFVVILCICIVGRRPKSTNKKYKEKEKESEMEHLTAEMNYAYMKT